MEYMGSLKAEGNKEEEPGTSLFHHLMAQRTNLEKDTMVLLQRLVVIAQLSRDVVDRKEVGAHYENLNFQLNKQFKRDLITGLLLIYPSCLLYIIESSRDFLLSVLKDLQAMQQKPDGTLLKAKIVFMAHNPESRMFQQWSYKVMDAAQVAVDTGIKRLEEDEESTETLVCSVLSSLQKLSENLQVSRMVLPGLVLDQTPQMIIPQKVLDKLLCRDELQSPAQHLQMYNSPLDISMEFGQVNPLNFYSSV
ncbi:testis-expressed protein 47 isoform X2 [Parambassis ranga]|uniref:Testis-expressed protein 47 isoform X2 n=1 Tax=Parambassis ranga TaxID=210632 RepID=A0A6P7KFJ7_9TELE|nr:testis-expressed protein 47 isoform X2 [Parambassis ranga]